MKRLFLVLALFPVLFLNCKKLSGRGESDPESTPIAASDPCSAGAFLDARGKNNSAYFRAKERVEGKEAKTKLSVLRPLFEGYFRAPGLMYKTGGQHDASVKFPRVLVANQHLGSIKALLPVAMGPIESAQFVAAFTLQEPLEAEVNDATIEILEVSGLYGRVCPRSISLKNARATFEDSPGSCVDCHGQDTRFLFEPYPLWPGMYPSSAGGSAKNSPEGQAYLKFIESNHAKSLFQWIGQPLEKVEVKAKKPEDVETYENYLVLRPSMEKLATEEAKLAQGGGPAGISLRVQFSDIFKQKVYGTQNLDAGFNALTFPEVIGDFSAVRFTRLLTATPRHGAYKFAILAGLLRCPLIPEFLPEKALKNHAKSFQEIKTETAHKIRVQALARTALVLKTNDSLPISITPGQDYWRPEFFDAIVALRYLLENRTTSPVSLAKWGTATVEYEFSQGESGITNVLPYYLETFGEVSETLALVFQSLKSTAAAHDASISAGTPQQCDALKAASLAAQWE